MVYYVLPEHKVSGNFWKKKKTLLPDRHALTTYKNTIEAKVAGSSYAV